MDAEDYARLYAESRIYQPGGSLATAMAYGATLSDNTPQPHRAAA